MIDNTDVQSYPESVSCNAPTTVTKLASALPRHLMPAQNMKDSNEATSVNGPLATIRSHSDSAIQGCRTPVADDSVGGPESKESLEADPTDIIEELDPDHVQAPHVKPRPHFQLPSFKQSGIFSRVPDALLTPPDETIIELKPDMQPNLIPRSSSFPPANLPKTPSPDRSDLRTILGNNNSMAKTSQTGAPAVTITATHETIQEEGSGPTSSRSDGGDRDLANASWMVDAVEAAVANIDPDGDNVVSVLCHSQPCPLTNRPDSATEKDEVTTAFHGLMSCIQNKIKSPHRSINVTHAIPVKFNMGQIPNSPVTTPSIYHANNAATDYFSLSSNVFSSAVVAKGHQDALKDSVPSSPHPVVPPASMSVSLLERFIPPSSAEEYLHLFSTDGPSVLFDRLFELSPHGGSLIFIYPTAAGATAFANCYLGPLLHPLLRTMCSIHSLSMDFGAQVGSAGAVDQMLSYESMTRKINLLLRKLSRGTSSIHRTTPKYTLLEHSKQSVDLDRKTWSDWWTHQETPRMRKVVERYLARGQMMPKGAAGKAVTAATLVQEVLDGVKEGRNYTDHDEERKGVEVGVYVIKRTA